LEDLQYVKYIRTDPKLMSKFIRRKIKEKTEAITETVIPNDPISKDITAILKMAKAYFVQETLLPLRKIKYKVIYALVGSLLVGIGFFLLLLAVLRVLQTETGSLFQGNESFAPYLITFIAGIFLIASASLYGLHAFKEKK